MNPWLIFLIWFAGGVVVVRVIDARTGWFGNTPTEERPVAAIAVIALWPLIVAAAALYRLGKVVLWRRP